MKKIQRSIIFVIGILLWVMQGQSVFAAGSTELLSGTIANTTISYRLTEDGTLTIYSDNIEEMPNYTVNSTVPWAAQKDKIKKVQINSYLEENAKEYEEYPKKLKACIEGYQETEEAIESLSQELPANVLK